MKVIPLPTPRQHQPHNKESMKTITKLTTVLALLTTILIVSGCATAEQPNYQGKKGATPTIDDYYPPKAK